MEARILDKPGVVFQSNKGFLRSDDVPLVEAYVKGEGDGKHSENHKVDQAGREEHVCRPVLAYLSERLAHTAWARLRFCNIRYSHAFPFSVSCRLAASSPSSTLPLRPEPK